MNSIDAMAHDIERQLYDLPVMQLPKPATCRAILCGSGDSYAAALAGYYLSSGRVSCCQPADILSVPSMVEGSSVYFISISGKTRSNLLAAKAARRLNAQTVAITADPKSPLAATCPSTFELEFTSSGKTSGTVSFTASLLASARIAVNATCPEDIKSIYRTAAMKAEALAEQVAVKNVVVLGESFLFPPAIYGALKFSEVFGSRASAYRLEDFCHAPLFGHKDDMLIIIERERGSGISRKLERAGTKVITVNCGKCNHLGSMFYAVFFIQHLVLTIARLRKMKECYFLQDENLLRASSDIIY